MKWIHRNQKPRIRRGQKSSDTFIARQVVDGEPINLMDMDITS